MTKFISFDATKPVEDTFDDFNSLNEALDDAKEWITDSLTDKEDDTVEMRIYKLVKVVKGKRSKVDITVTSV